MAGDWIKMRGQIVSHPKLIVMARHLQANADFREWLTPGGSGGINGQIVSNSALRCVTSALLMRVWSASREYGKFDGDNLILPRMSLSDIDAMAECPGVGEAMAAVGWATQDDANRTVVLPNFKQHNVPMSNAERQKGYRSRTKVTDDPSPRRNATVTKSVTDSNEGPVTSALPEKSREEKSVSPNGDTKRAPPARFTPPTIEEVDAYCRERESRVNPAAFVDYYDSVGWKVQGKPMKDWRAAVRTWERRNDERPNPRMPGSAASTAAANDDAVTEYLRRRETSDGGSSPGQLFEPEDLPDPGTPRGLGNGSW